MSALSQSLTTGIPAAPRQDHRVRLFTRLLLSCGILSSVWYVVINIITPLYYAGYSVASQTVSELSAIGAPSRSLWVLLCIFYSPLVIAFGWGVANVAPTVRLLRFTGMMMAFYGMSGFFWPPM